MKASGCFPDHRIVFPLRPLRIFQNDGGIEVLLLLVCIVGVVAFFSLALAFTSVLLEPQAYGKLAQDLETRQADKENKGKMLREIKKELQELALRSNSRNAVQQKRQEELSHQAAELAEEKEDLESRYHDLLERLGYINELLKRAPPPADPDRRKDLEKDKRDLEKRKGEVDKSLNSQKEQLAALGDLAEQKKKLRRLQEERRGLEEEVDKLKAKARYVIGTSHKNPLHIECRADGYILYPGREKISTNNFESVFRQKAAGHDLIAFWIRPEGFDSFQKAHAQAEEMKLPVSYEPVKETETLENVLQSLTDEKK